MKGENKMNGEKSPNIMFNTAKSYLAILLALSKALFKKSVK